jgi:cytosine/adenosine deaminase-related metal-dependent hydrolase
VRLLINARNRSIAVDGSHIVAQEGRFEVILDCGDADIRPGLINAHDHLHRNHYGRLGRPTYPNAYCWADDIQRRYRRRIARLRALPRREALLAGAWKNLFSGVTTVVHHDPWERDFDHAFPINVARVACEDSLGRSGQLDPPAEGSLCLHVAEGVDDVAAGEVELLDERGLLNERLVAVHGVGMDSAGIDRFRRAGAALVWCPTSNHFLFGRTAPGELLRDGVDVMIGSDSRLTADVDLLDELRAARAFGLVEDDRLADAVGTTAAKRLGLDEPSLEPGNHADLILLQRPLLDASAGDVLLTIVGGVPRVVHEDLASRLGDAFKLRRKMRVGAVVRWTNSDNGDSKDGGGFG